MRFTKNKTVFGPIIDNKGVERTEPRKVAKLFREPNTRMFSPPADSTL